jgi:hypothetical protein
VVLQRDADEVVEYNNIIDRLPEYYHGVHLFDILGNIAGVKLLSLRIWLIKLSKRKSPTLRNYFETSMGRTEGQADSVHALCYSHGSTKIISAAGRRGCFAAASFLPELHIVNVGKDPLDFAHERLVDCSEQSEFGIETMLRL